MDQHPPHRLQSDHILFEDNHLLVVNKPACLATMGAESGPTLHSLAADYLRWKYNKPGNVFVGVVSRLDTMTTGVIVLARTSKAASRLSPQFAAKTLAVTKTPPLPQKRNEKQNAFGQVRKVYLAILEKSPLENQLCERLGHALKAHHVITLEDHLAKDDRARRMRTVADGDQSGFASLRCLPLLENDDSIVVAVELMTGRKHQIRVQFSDRGLPILGDRKYRSRHDFSPGIALHSWYLRLTHPTRREPMEFFAPLAASWQAVLGVNVEAQEVWKRVHNAFNLNA